jgi:hypothetical protein
MSVGDYQMRPPCPFDIVRLNDYFASTGITYRVDDDRADDCGVSIGKAVVLACAPERANVYPIRLRNLSGDIREAFRRHHPAAFADGFNNFLLVWPNGQATLWFM